MTEWSQEAGPAAARCGFRVFVPRRAEHGDRSSYARRFAPALDCDSARHLPAHVNIVAQQLDQAIPHSSESTKTSLASMCRNVQMAMDKGALVVGTVSGVPLS